MTHVIMWCTCATFSRPSRRSLSHSSPANIKASAKAKYLCEHACVCKLYECTGIACECEWVTVRECAGYKPYVCAGPSGCEIVPLAIRAHIVLCELELHTNIQRSHTQEHCPHALHVAHKQLHKRPHNNTRTERLQIRCNFKRCTCEIRIIGAHLRARTRLEHFMKKRLRQVFAFRLLLDIDISTWS